MHGHCHQKSLMGIESDSALLTKLGVELEEIGSDCCGMAGSFGFEKDKYQVLIACGERVLLPAVWQADSETMIPADGFSYREQISQLTTPHALHVAQVPETGLNGCTGDPERELARSRKTERRQSMAHAAAAIGLALWPPVDSRLMFRRR